jgi:hypothetical protein
MDGRAVVMSDLTSKWGKGGGPVPHLKVRAEIKMPIPVIYTTLEKAWGAFAFKRQLPTSDSE